MLRSESKSVPAKLTQLVTTLFCLVLGHTAGRSGIVVIQLPPSTLPAFVLGPGTRKLASLALIHLVSYVCFLFPPQLLPKAD